MKQILFCLAVLSFIIASCSSGPKKMNPKSDKAENDSIQIIEQAYKNSTKTEYEIPVLKGSTMKHGIQKRFYLAGSLYSTIPYDHGSKQGIAYTYYQSSPDKEPQVWKEQPYVNNQLSGICRRYHRDGTLQAEYEYKDGMQAVGLKEFSESGKPISQPTLILTKNRINNGYYIAAHLSDNSENVDYFMGDLKDGKYLTNNLKTLQVKKGLGEIVIYENSGSITITAAYSTSYHNRGLVSKTVQLQN